MKIAIIGTGYVGLVAGACFAEAGNTVYCVDKDQSKISQIQSGPLPLFEPGLEDLVKRNIQNQRLILTTNLAEAINNSEINFIAVGTPQGEDGSADMQHVFQVCEEICKVAQKEIIIATKSTVPVGSGDQIEKLFQEKLKHPFVVFSNPEFLKEGDAVGDFMKPERVIIGTNDEKILPLVRRLYAPFTHQRHRMIIMNRRSAELTKYAANAMLASRISFMNEMAILCDKLGANINDVRTGLGSDSRIGPAFLYPGLGYGGSCFPKDVKALIKTALNADHQLLTVQASEEINKRQILFFYDKILKTLKLDTLKDIHFAVWGLAFKARTDDVRESPALKIVDLLLDAGARISAYDPEAMANTKKIYGDRISYAKNPLDAINGADALLVATDWNEFRSPDFEQIKKRLRQAVVFDGRNLYDANTMRELGFIYVGVGIPDSTSTTL